MPIIKNNVKTGNKQQKQQQKQQQQQAKVICNKKTLNFSKSKTSKRNNKNKHCNSSSSSSSTSSSSSSSSSSCSSCSSCSSRNNNNKKKKTSPPKNKNEQQIMRVVISGVQEKEVLSRRRTLLLTRKKEKKIRMKKTPILSFVATHLSQKFLNRKQRNNDKELIKYQIQNILRCWMIGTMIMPLVFFTIHYCSNNNQRTKATISTTPMEITLINNINQQQQQQQSDDNGNIVMPLRRQLQQDTDAMLFGNNNNNINFPQPIDCTTFNTQSFSFVDQNVNKKIDWYKSTDPNFVLEIYGKEIQFLLNEVAKPQSKQKHNTQSNIILLLQNQMSRKRVVEIGAHAGFFTMTAASLGHHVDVFEMNPSNILRICKSIIQNSKHPENKQSWHVVPSSQESLQYQAKIYNNNNNSGNNQGSNPASVNIYHVAMLNTTHPNTFPISKIDITGRMGRGVFRHQVEYVPGFAPSPFLKNQQPRSIPAMTLDQFASQHNWFQNVNNNNNNNNIVGVSPSLSTTTSDLLLLKIDVEYMEDYVLQGAKETLKHQLFPNIMMDMDCGQNKLDYSRERTIFELLSNSSYVVYKRGRYNGAAAYYPPADDEKVVQELIDNCKESAGVRFLWWVRSRNQVS